MSLLHAVLKFRSGTCQVNLATPASPFLRFTMSLETSEDVVQYQVPREKLEIAFRRIFVTPRVKRSVLFCLAFGTFGVVMGKLSQLWPLAFIVFGVVFGVIMYRYSKKWIAQHPEFLEPQTLTFGPQRFSVTNSAVSVGWPWERVKRIREYDDVIILSVDTFGTGALIFKNALTPEQLTRLRSYLERAAVN